MYNEEELDELIKMFKKIYREHIKVDFPQDPWEQLKGAIDAVFNSWMADKAVTYRKVEKLVGIKGTAVNVVQMVFGNKGETSGTGVCFTRDPNSGENVILWRLSGQCARRGCCSRHQNPHQTRRA